ncbi:MAG: cation:proton antiporter [Bdellovibrio bacteriovorus]
MLQQDGIAVAHADPIAPVIFGVTLILLAALIGRYGARRLGQPSVLGELVIGVLLGNFLVCCDFQLMRVLREGTACLDMATLTLEGMSWDQAAQTVMGPEGAGLLALLRGPHGGEYLQIVQAVDVFSRYGVIFLLFHVGLDTCVAELRQVGTASLRVAVIGVAVPFSLGFLVAWLLDRSGSLAEHLFLGAALGATSIGISARVLGDLNQTHSPEAHVILGASVMDDVLGLILLAVVSGIAVTGHLAYGEVLRISLLAGLFIVAVLMSGKYIIRALVLLMRHLDVLEAKLFISFLFVMALSWAANLVGLATIVGAFAAGLLLMDSHFDLWGDHRQHKYSIKELFAPIEAVMVPIFFVLMGIQVKLEDFLDPHALLLAFGLTAAAVLGKLAAGLGVCPKKGISRLAVGVGMLPRGEVGLVFAAIGKSLGVIDASMFSAVVVMVMVTSLATPPLLKRVMDKVEAAPVGGGHVRPCD